MGIQRSATMSSAMKIEETYSEDELTALRGFLGEDGLEELRQEMAADLGYDPSEAELMGLSMELMNDESSDESSDDELDLSTLKGFDGALPSGGGKHTKKVGIT